MIRDEVFRLLRSLPRGRCCDGARERRERLAAFEWFGDEEKRLVETIVARAHRAAEKAFELAMIGRGVFGGTPAADIAADAMWFTILAELANADVKERRALDKRWRADALEGQRRGVPEAAR